MTRMMKDSGIEWIGEVPSDWEISRYKRYSRSSMGNTILKNDLVEDLDKDSIPVYSATQEDIYFGYINKNDVTVILNKNDLVIPARGNSIGCTKIVASDKATCTQTTIYSKIRDIVPKYLYYCSIAFKKYWFEFDRTAIPQITVQQIENNYLPVCPLEEQKRIADYLDKKCTEIEGVRESIEAEIETLEEYKKSMITEAVTKGLDKDCEMKDSDIEWIGAVPKHWKGIRLKDISNLVRGGSPRPISNYMSDDDNDLNWIKIGDANKDSKYITKTKCKLKKTGLNSTTVVKKGDLILSNSMSYGEAYILDIDGCIHDGWLAFKDIKNIMQEYLYFILLSKSTLIQFDKLSDGGVVKNLNIDKVKTVKLFLPPINEQKAIADYLDHKTNLINEAIEGKKVQLLSLDEYKKSLIYEYVTGKKEVPHEDAL